MDFQHSFLVFSQNYNRESTVTNKRICRLCLTYPSVYFSLVDKKHSEMLEALTSIKVHSDDVLSTISCLKCLLNMKLAFNIQQNILKADGKLKDVSLLNNVEVKRKGQDVMIDPETPELSSSEELPKLCCSSCVICGLEKEDSDLAKHVEEHFNSEQICDYCNKSFSNINEYKGHVANKHKECKDTCHKCEKCNVTFYYRSLYNLHMAQLHPVEQENPTQGKSNDQLIGHSHEKKEFTSHNGVITRSNYRKQLLGNSSGPQICELCGATLKGLGSLRAHLTNTHSTAIYNCDECDQVFRKRYTYILHKKKHSGVKTHMCETCGKAFMTLYYLNKHIKSKHLKLRPFICEYCKKAFSSKFALTTHVRQHTNETPYKCEVCGDGFRQNVSLKAHRKSKHNIVEEKTCACPVCGKLFTCDQAVTSHMRLH